MAHTMIESQWPWDIFKYQGDVQLYWEPVNKLKNIKTVAKLFYSQIQTNSNS